MTAPAGTGVYPLTTLTPPMGTTPTGAFQSGIAGLVTLGPACPGPVRIGDTQCADKPYQATFTVLDTAGQVVLHFQTDPDGRFRIELAPGVYTLHPEKKSAFPITHDQDVVVTAGQFVDVQIKFDSGMR